MAGRPGQSHYGRATRTRPRHATGPPGRWDTEATGLQTQQTESRDSRGNRVTRRDSAAFESTRNAETPRLPRVVEKRAPEAPNRVKSARVTGHSAPWCRPGDQGGLWGERSPLYLSSAESLNSQGPRQPCLAGHAQRASLSAAVAAGTRTRHSHSPWGHGCHLSAGRRLRRSQAARAPAAVYPP